MFGGLFEDLIELFSCQQRLKVSIKGYIGAGVRFLSHDDISRIGLRIPLGISFDFTNQPIDLFAEFTPIVDFSVSDAGRGVADLSVVTGVRYFL